MKPMDSLRGCTFGILGDSYSTFQDCIPEGNACYYPRVESVDDVLRVEDTWWHQLMERTGMQLLVNDSFSGATVCTHVREKHTVAAAFTQRAKRSFSGDCTLDYIIVFGGTNDNWLGRSFGQPQFEGWTEEDLRQTLPAYCYTLNHIRAHHPQSVILSVINTGFPRELMEGMEAAAHRYSAVTVRLADIHKQNGHPTALGMRQIAEQIQKAFSWRRRWPEGPDEV